MHPYINEALAAERVRSLQEEAATRRLVRRARRARWAVRFRRVPGPRRSARLAAGPV